MSMAIQRFALTARCHGPHSDESSYSTEVEEWRDKDGEWVRYDDVQDELERLTAVALAARALVRSASGNALLRDEDTVSEPALTALESALAEAGYDMTDEELAQSEEQR